MLLIKKKNSINAHPNTSKISGLCPPALLMFCNSKFRFADPCLKQSRN